MTDRIRGCRTLAAVALTAAALLVPPVASAQGHRGGGGGHGHGGGGVVIVGGGFYSPWFGFGAGWGPWGYYGYGPWGYPPAYFTPEGGVPMGVAMMNGFGAVDLDVKPNRADVWVDGKYAGEARDLDGYPSYLWLKEGAHRLQIQKGGYKIFDEEIETQPGMKKDLKVRLEPGESEPPSGKPDAKGSVKEQTEKPREKKF
jgi:PEGA domain